MITFLTVFATFASQLKESLKKLTKIIYLLIATFVADFFLHFLSAYITEKTYLTPPMMHLMCKFSDPYVHPLLFKGL